MSSKKKKSSKVKKNKHSEKDEKEERRKELVRQATDLKYQIGKEKKDKNTFDERLEKIKHFWAIKNQNVEEKKLKLKEKEEYLLQIERSHQEKVDSIKEEIKRQLYREENSLSRTKDHVEVELIITKDEHGATQAKIISSIKEKQQNLKELQISLHDFKVQIQRDHDISVRGLQEDFKRRAMVIIEDSERKVKQIREEFEEQIKKDMQILELEMDEQTRDLIKKHGMDTDRLGNQFNESIHGDLETIEQLKIELKTKKKRHREVEKHMNELNIKNRNIVEPYTKAQADLEKSACDLKSFNEERNLLDLRNKEMKKLEEKLKNSQWRYEVLFQRCEILERERDQHLKHNEFNNLKNRQEIKLKKLLEEENMITLHKLATQHLCLLSEGTRTRAQLTNDSESRGEEMVDVSNSVSLREIKEIRDEIEIEHDNVIARISNDQMNQDL